jgi:DNA-binding NtrC family response regulator
MNIMLIDDDTECLDSLDVALSSKGFFSTKFSNPLKAIKAFANESFDLVITDIKMPHMDGIQVLKKIIVIDSGTPVIAITAFDDIANSDEVLKAGARAFFYKPLNIKKLLATLYEIDAELND